MWHSGGAATIDQLARRGRKQAHERGERRPNANADVDEPAGTLEFRVRASTNMDATGIVGMTSTAGITSG